MTFYRGISYGGLLFCLLFSASSAYTAGDPDAIQGNDVFLSASRYEELLQQANNERIKALDAADRCDYEGYRRAQLRLYDYQELAVASGDSTNDLITRMIRRLIEILEQLAKFLPGGDPYKPAIDSALGVVKGFLLDKLGDAGGSGLADALQGVADDIDKMEEGSDILGAAQTQFQNIQIAQVSLARWKKFHEAVTDDLRLVSGYRVRTDCYKEELSDEGVGFVPSGFGPIIISGDTPLWCTYGGTSIPLFPWGVSPPTTTPVPSPLAPPPNETPQSDPPIPGAPNAGGDPLPPVPGVEPPPLTETPTGAPATPSGGIPTMPVNPTDDPEEEGEDEPEQDPPTVPLAELKIKATTATLMGGSSVAAAGALLTLNTAAPALAGDTGAVKTDDGYDEGEMSATTDDQGNASFFVAQGYIDALGTNEISVDVSPSVGTVMAFAGDVAPQEVLASALLPYAQNVLVLGSTTFISLLIPEYLVAGLQTDIDAAAAIATSSETDWCVDPKPLAEPFFNSKGTWGQAYDDQWALKRVGFTDAKDSAWNRVRTDATPVTIAVIDSGLDWNHQEIRWDGLWRNDDEIAGNNIDDDNNGYIDDTIGWDFWNDTRKPWDNDGHGTFVAGVMFADPDNASGIAGISRHAKLMVLKAMNAFGHSRSSYVAAAIKYATDNGARVINLSLGGKGSSTVIREAVEYAYERNVVVVVAAGNEATNTDQQNVAGLPHALTVASIGFNDKRSIYSNYGSGIDLAAPGDDILSLRARRTDLLKNIPGVDYEAESAFVGDDRRYYRASGTSFATPIVAGIAGLVIANNPELTAEEVMRVLKQSARDVETPGIDHFTGYGVVDAAAALSADPTTFIHANISGVSVKMEVGKQMVQVLGSAAADSFKYAKIYIGQGEKPNKWQQVAMLKKAISKDVLTTVPATSFAGSTKWTIRVETTHKNGKTQQFWFLLNLG